ncbi:FkbM family methyltransferase [Brevundimonas diminuta]|uniref:FkbM family methyltransferase n=1 Tax=Brevundimonas diminuta TaxID=293 RepID=UPI003D9A645F
MISYAQNFEDVILRRALRDVASGFYIDIGAQHPIIDSVSLAFYEAGWRGVHVEPSPIYADALRASRPDEVVVQAAVSSTKGQMTFFEFPHTGLSTGLTDIAEKHRSMGFSSEVISVDTLPLSALLDSYADRDIHWLKIDCEGMERDILETWSPSNVLPWIVVVESTAPGSTTPTHHQWESILESRGYVFAYNDSLNRFYVSPEKEYLLSVFGPPPNCFDGFQVSAFTQGFHLLRNEIAHSRARLVALRAEISEADVHCQAIRKLETTSLALDVEASRRGLAERLLADAEARLGETTAHAQTLAIDLENHRQAVGHLQRTVAERDEELRKIKAGRFWQLLQGLARTKKKIARARRSVLARAGITKRTQKFTGPVAQGAHDTTSIVVGRLPLLLVRAAEIERQIGLKETRSKVS